MKIVDRDVVSHISMHAGTWEQTEQPADWKLAQLWLHCTGLISYPIWARQAQNT